jgi:hypothetical protein
MTQPDAKPKPKPASNAAPSAKMSGHSPTKKEIAAAQNVLERINVMRAAPRFKVSHDKGKTKIEPHHSDQTCTDVLLSDMLATGDQVFAQALLVHISNFAQMGDQLTSDDLNTTISIVKEIGPRDPIEALLACQMAAIHKATVYTARRFDRCDMLDQYQATGNQLNKLARTFAAQMEALKRYRSSGEQSIRVQHVTVNDGGQAIVGTVTGGGGTSKNASQSRAPRESGTDERRPALSSQEQALGLPLPSPGRDGQERLPDARRESRSPDRQSQWRMEAWDGEWQVSRPPPNPG